MLVPPKELEGVLLIDKPTDHTSHDVIARLRGILKMKRIGHAGTLDPMATGILIVLVGKATRASQYLMSVDKEYTGTISLGKVTNTQDAEGEMLETRPVPPFTQEQILAAMKTFIGDQYQTPPMFSAIKIDGVPLYKAARKGEEIEREPRFIRVSKFELHRWETPEIDFTLRCSKGTYVRTIAHDLGQKLECGAHLSRLRRTGTGKFTDAQCVTLEHLQKLPRPEIEKLLIPVHEAVPSVAL
ncbi:tRNA pseudouridine55 synthase [Ereboglobus sp. PH5-5]|uniref:tRNA pseudouridine synthase B n=1 Tax=Ereboglobus luteus TaxID=1796921 RepID=A0A2U8E4N2_9BACT|nr:MULTISPECIES: tRNA pseudouridine(55) synthase TruB [Ereboglobus]AWI09482.1 tRNA pseudouridine(55) synthase TruB [Ereboglobus luteus]MDF9834271.1 tRNA pseudouridine55 synthase [Ereboglobus sp. PH5-5]